MKMEMREIRRGRPSNDCGERDEMELPLITVKERDEDGKEKGKMEKEDEQERQTGERGETTRRNHTQSFVLDANGME